MVCFWCLVDNRGKKDAVTAWNGTPMCEECARQHAETIREAGNRWPSWPS